MDRTYCGPPPQPGELWASWNFDPLLIAALVLLAVFLRRERAGLAAVGVLAFAFVSPLCALSSALFSARVAHHVLLVAVAAPLLAAALPKSKGIHGAPAFAISTAILWIWHIPPAYDLALNHVGVYWIMQISLLASATWFWQEVLTVERSPVEALALIVAGFAQMGMLGAIITFAPNPLYAAHLVAPYEWGLSPLSDQQLGGLLMWVPAGLPYAVAAAFIGRRGWRILGSRSS